LRAAINVGNVVLVQTDPDTGEPKGISVELAREIAARLEVPIDLIVYNAAGKVFEALTRKGMQLHKPQVRKRTALISNARVGRTGAF
jgi:membrane-bound lytic murein transglycosylase MltF